MQILVTVIAGWGEDSGDKVFPDKQENLDLDPPHTFKVMYLSHSSVAPELKEEEVTGFLESWPVSLITVRYSIPPK